MVLIAVQNTGQSIKFANPRFLNHKEVGKAAVKSSGSSLFDLSSKLKDDEEIVLEAVKSFPESIFFSSLRIKSNKVIAMECVKRNGLTLQFLIDLNQDRDVVIEALRENLDSIEFVHKSLQNDIFVYMEINGMHHKLLPTNNYKKDILFTFLN